MKPATAISWTGLALLLWAGPSANAAEIIKTLDRKFPIGKFCPLESRAAASVDLSFVAPASTVRITFAGNNETAGGNWNQFHIDDVSVTTKAVFDANLISPVPNFADCYNTSTPPGQSTGGLNNAPGYKFEAPGTTELLLDVFTASTSGWSGAFVSFDGTKSAPNAVTTGTDTSGGSLALGQEADGAVQVWASKTVTGLTPGVQYVVFGWWYAFETSPITIRIGVPCADVDGDSVAVCTGSCDLGLGQTCGDCNDNNSHCGASCTDHDADGWCAGFDCDDNAATCISNCAPDADADAVPDCRDGCIDLDRDGYGTAGGAGNSCAGADCSEGNRYCNVSCTDADGDARCTPGDCDDSDSAVGNELAEVNDCFDQQCVGSPGFGVADEISGTAGFAIPGSKNVFSWPLQTGATNYHAVRSMSPAFTSACVTQTTGSTSWTDAANPPTGGAFYYLVRPFSGCKGSFGQRSNGTERAPICGQETACANGADDDGDGGADCVDPDCAATAACTVRTFTFTDGIGDDIADNALWNFFNSFQAHNSQYFFFEVVEPRGTLAWCSERARFYWEKYLALAPSNGTAASGAWNKWRKAPLTGNAWVLESGTHTNEYGDDSFGAFSWCSEQFGTEPRNCIFPNRTNDCEIYDLTTGACRTSSGTGTWQLTIRTAATRLRTCGF